MQTEIFGLKFNCLPTFPPRASPAPAAVEPKYPPFIVFRYDFDSVNEHRPALTPGPRQVGRIARQEPQAIAGHVTASACGMVCHPETQSKK